MTFEEAYQKLREGTATDEEAAFVARELENVRRISAILVVCSLLAIAAIVCAVLFIPSNLSASEKQKISKAEAIEIAYAGLVEQVGEDAAEQYYVDYAHRHLRYAGSIFEAVYVYRIQFEDSYDNEYTMEVNANSGYTVIRDMDLRHH